VFVWGFGVLFLSCACVCVGVGGVVLCRCMCVCDLLIFSQPEDPSPTVSGFDSRALTSAIIHLMRGDVEALVEDGIALRFLPPDIDRAALIPPLRKVILYIV